MSCLISRSFSCLFCWQFLFYSFEEFLFEKWKGSLAGFLFKLQLLKKVIMEMVTHNYFEIDKRKQKSILNVFFYQVWMFNYFNSVLFGPFEHGWFCSVFRHDCEFYVFWSKATCHSNASLRIFFKMSNVVASLNLSNSILFRRVVAVQNQGVLMAVRESNTNGWYSIQRSLPNQGKSWSWLWICYVKKQALYFNWKNPIFWIMLHNNSNNLGVYSILMEIKYTTFSSSLHENCQFPIFPFLALYTVIRGII